jgi:rubrerythrin
MSDRKTAEAIQAGLETEQQGLKAYEAAAARSRHPFARKMFESLANDERRHAEWFAKLAAERGVAPAPLDRLDPDGFLKSIRKTFKGLRAKIRGMSPDADDIKAIEVALTLETKSFQMYDKAAKSATDPAEKALFQFIAREENNHWAILDDARLYLTNPEKWNIKQEAPLIDGGA